MRKPRTLKECREHSYTDELWVEHDELDPCGNNGKSYWLALNPGLFCESTETHTIHEWSVKDLCDAIATVVPCTCEDCVADTYQRTLRTN